MQYSLRGYMQIPPARSFHRSRGHLDIFTAAMGFHAHVRTIAAGRKGKDHLRNHAW